MKAVYPNWSCSVDPKIVEAWKFYREMKRFGFTMRTCAFSKGCNYASLRKYASQKNRGIVDV